MIVYVCPPMKNKKVCRAPMLDKLLELMASPLSVSREAEFTDVPSLSNIMAKIHHASMVPLAERKAKV